MCIEHETADADRRRHASSGSPYQPAHPGDEFDDLERLAQVVVDAGLDARDFFRPVVARGDDDHGKRSTVVTPAAQHREAVEAWQSKVEDRHVIVLGGPFE